MALHPHLIFNIRSLKLIKLERLLKDLPFYIKVLKLVTKFSTYTSLAILIKWLNY